MRRVVVRWASQKILMTTKLMVSAKKWSQRSWSAPGLLKGRSNVGGRRSSTMSVSTMAKTASVKKITRLSSRTSMVSKPVTLLSLLTVMLALQSPAA